MSRSTKRETKCIVDALRDRQCDGLDGRPPSVHCLSNRVIPLPDVMDQERQLVNGHVILGFSQCGGYLLSYQHVCDSDQGEHGYTLHWWTFNLYHPLVHLCEHALFGGSFKRDAHLVMAQTPRQSHTVAFGCMRAVSDEDRRLCHVTVTPGPGLSGPTVHFKYELLPPFPSLLPHLTLQIPGCLLVNTGDRLIAVQYDHTPHNDRTVHCQWFSEEVDSIGLDSSEWASVKWHTHTHTLAIGECSPSHLLPVEVFVEQRQLSPSTKGEVCVGQSVLDVEVWTIRVLCAELETYSLSYHCLLDYDLQIVDVCVDAGEAVFVMIALLEVSSPTGSHDCVSVEVVGVWDVFEGAAVMRHMSPPVLVPGHTHPPVSVSAEANRLRALSCVPPGLHTLIRAFSNRSLLSGKSLRCLSHPKLPIYLTLYKTT